MMNELLILKIVTGVSVCVMIALLLDRNKWRSALRTKNQSPRPKIFDRYEGMSDRQLDMAFASGKNHEVYLATCQIIDAFAKELVALAADSKLPSTETKFYLGGVGALADLREMMEARGLEDEQKSDNLE